MEVAYMDKIAKNLHNIFANYLYPAIILLTFGFLLFTIWALIHNRKNKTDLHIRMIIGATMPLVILIFILASFGKGAPSFLGNILNISAIVRVGIGISIGIVIFEAGYHVYKSDADIAPTLYVFALSSFAMFILYNFIVGYIQELSPVLMGFIIGAGTHVMFRGPFEKQSIQRGLRS